MPAWNLGIHSNHNFKMRKTNAQAIVPQRNQICCFVRPFCAMWTDAATKNDEISRTNVLTPPIFQSSARCER